MKEYKKRSKEENAKLKVIRYNIPSWDNDSTLHFDSFDILLCPIGKLPALFNLFDQTKGTLVSLLVSITFIKIESVCSIALMLTLKENYFSKKVFHTFHD